MDIVSIIKHERTATLTTTNLYPIKMDWLWSITNATQVVMKTKIIDELLSWLEVAEEARRIQKKVARSQTSSSIARSPREVPEKKKNKVKKSIVHAHCLPILITR